MIESSGQLRPLTFTPQDADDPVLVSAGTPWGGIPIEVHELRPFEGPFEFAPAPSVRGMMIVTEGSREVVLQEGRSQSRIRVTPGLMGFAEGGQRRKIVRATGWARAVVFELPPTWHERLLIEGGAEKFDRLPPIPPNKTACALATAISTEVANNASTGTMFAESLSFAVLAYMLERTPQTRMRVRGGLSDAQRRRLARYIDERLDQDISLAEVAALVGFRPRHFSTLFRRAFGASPHRYLMERRLEHGARLLGTTDIAEVALRVGFSSQSHFAVAFRKRFGMSPRQYARSKRATFAGS